MGNRERKMGGSEIKGPAIKNPAMGAVANLGPIAALTVLLLILSGFYVTPALAATTASAVDSITLEVAFPQAVQQATAENAANYKITGGPEGLVVQAAVRQADTTKVRLTTSVQEVGVGYTLEVSNMSYAAGGSLPQDGVENVAQFSGFNPGTTLDKPKIIGLQGGAGRVTVTWETVPGATSYELYRSQDGAAWGAPIASGNILNFTDTGLTDYLNYFYKVRATDGTLIVESSVARAFPPDTSPHGYNGVDTEPCAACHNTHAGSSAKLLTQPSSVTLCVTCHDGTQSKYDVLSGQVNTNTGIKTSPAGPFGTLQPGAAPISTTAPYNYGGAQVPNQTPTSIHNVGIGLDSAPGSQITNTNKLGAPLECINCHNPHNYDNYRMLRQDLDVRYGAEENVFRAYAITDANGETVRYVTGAVRFCGYCHSDFNQGAGSGSTLAKTTKQIGYTITDSSLDKTMHAVNVNKSYAGLTPPVTVNGVQIPCENDKIICLTCHRAHGTVVTGESPVRNSKQSTALKRAEAMFICETCHDKTNNPY